MRKYLVFLAWCGVAALLLVGAVVVYQQYSASAKDLAYIAGPMFGTAILPLLWYCFRSHGREDFHIWKFFFSNKGRLGIGAVMMGFASLLIYAFPEVQAVLALGLGSGVAYAAIGWTVGSTLVALVPGNK